MALIRDYRYLYEQMVRRELRQKYKGSALGVLYYLINPLVLAANPLTATAYVTNRANNTVSLISN